MSTTVCNKYYKDKGNVLILLVALGKCSFDTQVYIEATTVHWSELHQRFHGLVVLLTREFKKTSTATATGAALNKRFTEQNNGCVRVL